MMYKTGTNKQSSVEIKQNKTWYDAKTSIRWSSQHTGISYYWLQRVRVNVTFMHKKKDKNKYFKKKYLLNFQTATSLKNNINRF